MEDADFNGSSKPLEKRLGSDGQILAARDGRHAPRAAQTLRAWRDGWRAMYRGRALRTLVMMMARVILVGVGVRIEHVQHDDSENRSHRCGSGVCLRCSFSYATPWAPCL